MSLHRTIPLALAAAAIIAIPPACSKSSERMSILARFPARKETGVEPTTMIWVRFSTAVRNDSVTSRTFKVQDAENGPVAGTFSFAENDRKVLFTPSDPLPDGAEVTVTVNSGLRGKSGVTARHTSFSFTVREAEPPPPAPLITARSPSPNSIGVDPGASVVIEFDQAMDPFSFNASSIVLWGNLGGRIPVDISGIVQSGNRVQLLPRRMFHPGERVTVAIGANLHSSSNRPFAGESYSFLAAGGTVVDGLEPGPEVTTGGNVIEVIAADLDADGIPDLAARTDAGTAIELFRGLGKGEFEPRNGLPLTQRALSLAVLDLDGDGRLDILAGTIDRLAIFRNTGSGLAFENTSSFGTGTPVHAIVHGDIDHRDLQIPDLVLDTGRGLQIYLKGLQGTPFQTIGDQRIPRTPPVLADIDRDGFPDLVYGDSVGNRVAIRRFIPGSGFGDPQGLALPTDATAVLPADLDRDGQLEIIALAPRLEGGEGIHFLIPGSGAGGIQGEPVLLATLGPSSLSLTDLDGDGWIDLLLANPETGKIRFLKNLQGSFDPDAGAVEFPGDLPVRQVIAFDFTGDRLLDLLAPAGDRLITLLSEVEQPPPPPPPPPVNRLSMTATEAVQGASGAAVPIVLENESRLDGFTVVVGFESSALSASGVAIDGTALEPIAPEFENTRLETSEGYLAYDVIFDFMPPFSDKHLPAGGSKVIFKALFDVAAGAAIGDHPLTFPQAAGTAAASTVLIAGGLPVPFTAVPSTFKVTAAPPPPPPPPPPPENTLGIAAFAAKQGDRAVSTSVTLSNDSPIDAYTILISFDPAALTAAAIQLEGTVLQTLAPDFSNVRLLNDQGILAHDVIFDFIPPFDGKRLLAGKDRVLFKPVFDVKPDAPIGEHPLAFPASAGNGSDRTQLLSAGQPVPLTVLNASASIGPGPPPPANPNKLRIADRQAAAGDKGRRTTAFLTSEVEIQAFTMTGTYPPASIVITGFDIENTITKPLLPEFVAPKIREDLGVWAFSVIFDMVPPFNQQRILPGMDMAIANIIFDIPGTTAPGSYLLDLKNEVGDPPLSNTLVKEGQSVFPDLFDGTITISAAPPAPQFIRGDVNLSAKVDIGDQAFLLNFLFRDGPAPECMDAADVNDNGKIDIEDTLLILQFIFKGTPVPPPPYPLKGPDPTPDAFDCARGL